MKRRDFLVGIIVYNGVPRRCGGAWQVNRVAFVAPLHPSDISETGDTGPLFQELRRLGYVVGQNPLPGGPLPPPTVAEPARQQGANHADLSIEA